MNGKADQNSKEALAKALLDPSTIQKSENILKETLINSDVIQIYFGSNGEWRKQIIKERKAKEFKKKLHEKFAGSLNSTIDGDVEQKLLKAFCDSYPKKCENATIANAVDKAKELYKSALGFLESEIVLEIDSVVQHDFTNEALVKYIYVGLDEALTGKRKGAPLVEILQKEEVINKFFNFDKMRDVLGSDNILVIKKIVDEIIASSDRQDDFSGEWLDDGEIEFLWKKERARRDSIIKSSAVCGLKTIPNFDFIGMKDIDEVTPYIEEEIENHLNKKQQFFQIFPLGTMRQSGDTGRSRGHWYPLVMHQNNDGNRKYYIMDSANNRDRTHDRNARKIINLIEQKAQEKLQSQSQETPQLLLGK